MVFNAAIDLGILRVIRLCAPLAALFASFGLAQCPVTTDLATYPTPPLTYPMTSDRYAVQYQLGGSGTWTTAQVYISYYGGTNASPNRSSSGYDGTGHSMSFVSIPPPQHGGGPPCDKAIWFGLSGHRPGIGPAQAKKIHVDSA